MDQFKLEQLIENQADEVSVSYRGGDGIFYADILLTFAEAVSPQVCSFRFLLPCTDMHSIWRPGALQSRYISPNWCRTEQPSRLASGAPILAAIAKGDQNRATVALSDANTATCLSCGAHEDGADMEFRIDLFTQLTAPLKEYRVTVRVDVRPVPYWEALRNIEAWWRCDLGYTPAHVPDAARLPVDSLWYSFHQAVETEKILEECRISKLLGMDTVIIDDGWETPDDSRGFIYCGDWEPSPNKIPDMRALADALHEMGMKVMIWFSVPYVGIHSKLYERFIGKYVCASNSNKTVMCLDPRYPDVREYLVNVYQNAVRDWHLDGLKLDFIDALSLGDISPEFDERRDTVSLEDGLEKLLCEVTDALRAVDPEIMIEFRQTYIGPTIRKYGNMLRVSDCPNDAIRNRIGSVDLRLISGKTAVHSDMIMWHTDEKPEHAAIQLLSVLFAVPQISLKLACAREEHKKLIAAYLAFWKAHRNVLLDGELTARSPEAGYTYVAAQGEGENIVVRYENVPFELRTGMRNIFFNATADVRAVILSDGAAHTYTVYDCLGSKAGEGRLDRSAFVIDIPMSGRIEID